MNGYIYKITSPSGRIYIGQTINLKTRINNYKNLKCKKQIKLYNSIIKYGWNNHNLEIIEEVLCLNDKFLLNFLEAYWINVYNSFKKGLNCTIGGDGTMGHKHSEETKKILRDKATGKILSEISKNKISIASKGNQYNKGRVTSKETKEKLKSKSSGRIISNGARDKISKANSGRT